MKKEEILIIFLLAVLVTILTFHWWGRSVQWVYGLASGARYYPWPLTPFSYYQWWFPLHVLLFWFMALGVGWSAVGMLKGKNRKLKIAAVTFLGGIILLIAEHIDYQKADSS